MYVQGVNQGLKCVLFPLSGPCVLVLADLFSDVNQYIDVIYIYDPCVHA
jgi:hypothetical protein